MADQPTEKEIDMKRIDLDTDTTVRPDRVRKPSPAQYALLHDLRAAGAGDKPVRAGEVEHQHRIATWLSVVERGYVTVDRKTPDNVGGNPVEYDYALTSTGYIAMDIFVSPPARTYARRQH